MESRSEEDFRLEKQLACESDHVVGVVPEIVLLRLGGQNEEIGGRMVDVDFLENGMGVVGDEQFIDVVHN